MKVRLQNPRQRAFILSIIADGTSFKQPELLADQLRKAHQMSRSSLQELSIVLTGDATMKKVHKRFMGEHSPTDVLTFPLESDSRDVVISGEVVICMPEAKRQTKKLGTKLEHEVLLYAIHGLLHLSGWDDRTAAQFQRMHRKEDEILRRLGVGPVFAPAAAKGR